MKNVKKVSIVIAIMLLIVMIFTMITSVLAAEEGDPTNHIKSSSKYYNSNISSGHKWYTMYHYNDTDRVAAKINKIGDKIDICAYCMSTYYNNMYCVYHAANLQSALYNKGDISIDYTAVAKAEIDGNIVTFTSCDANGKEVITKVEDDSGFSNKLAAVFNNPNEFEYGYVVSAYPTYGGPARSNYTYAQLAIYYLWGNWVKGTGAAAYGFDEGDNTVNENNIGAFMQEKVDENGNSYIDIWASNKDAVLTRWKGIEEKLKTIDTTTKNYKATIWFLEYESKELSYTNDANETVTKTIQNLIIADPGGEEENTIDIPVQKVWNDNNGTVGNRPTSITVELYKKTSNTAETSTGKTLTLNADNNWKGSFEELPETEDGYEITYTVKEKNVSYEYKSSISGSISSGFTITNTPTIQIPVTKKWDDNENVDRPSSITVELYQTINNEKTSTGKTLTLGKSYGWTTFFEPMPLIDKNGNQITYTVEEVNVPEGYMAVISGNMYAPGFTITNTSKLDIPVTKVWEDGNNKDNLRPDSIKVTLYKNGVATNQTVTLNESNNWKATFIDLRKYENGSEITYTVKEENVPTGYTAEIIGDMTTGYTIKNIHDAYEGYIEITGKVWVDKLGGKANELNGKLDDDESGLEGIKVVLKDANGNQFDATSTAITDGDGIYTIKVNYDNSQNVYKLYEDVTVVVEKLKTAYIEFEYNAMKYTTVAVAGNGNTDGDTSKAIENEVARNSFDEKYQIITSQTDIAQIEAETITANTKNVIDFATYSAKANYVQGVTIKSCDGNGKSLQTNSKGAWLDIEEEDVLNHTCPGKAHRLVDYGVEVIRIQNINLGLFEREQPDVAIFLDLYKVNVTTGKFENEYIYGTRGGELENKYGLQVKFQNKDTYTYRRPIDPNDIREVQEGTNTISVTVTYKVSIGNLSNSLPIVVHKINNYFDSRYTLNTDEWSIVNTGEQFSVAENNNVNIEVEPSTQKEVGELTYTVGMDAIKDLTNDKATLNNAVEIESYTTKYGENTLYAEQTTKGRTGNKYGGYDYDSHPGNAAIEYKTATDIKKEYERVGKEYKEENIIDRLYSYQEVTENGLEDDTDMAASFVLHQAVTYRTLSGNVWEDTNVGQDGFRVGDGSKLNSEKNVKNVKVELFIVNPDGTLSPAKLKGEDKETLEKIEIDAIAYTDENGNYTFGDKEKYGLPEGEYIIKFTYGKGIGKEDGTTTDSTIADKPISARDYKSTIISSTSSVYDVFKGTSTSKDWYLNMTKGYSIAVDDMNERKKISDLNYSNFNEPIKISASSKPFGVSGEFEKDVFDFGIIERAREDIVVETTIEHLKITLANGQVLTEGNPQVDEMNYAKSVGFNARTALEKQMMIEMDTELMQGAELEIQYKIKVKNNSEKDIDYTQETDFYYFGDYNENSPIITEPVNKVVAYMDAGMTYTWGNEATWTQKTASDLDEAGLISKATYDAINNNEYIVFTTETAKEEYTVTASKVLANATEENDNVYDIHAEILEIDDKTARTTKTRDDAKEYKMGNYVPSLDSRKVNTDINKEEAGLHEQDDDKVKVIITPPTGDGNYIITYVITGLVGLIVIAIAVMFIKKKVLTK